MQLANQTQSYGITLTLLLSLSESESVILLFSLLFPKQCKKSTVAHRTHDDVITSLRHSCIYTIYVKGGFNSVMQAITLAMRIKYNHYCG